MTDSHWVAQALATLPVLADVAVMLVAWFYLFLVSIFGLLGGVKIRDGDDTYLAEPMWLEPTFYCYRYEGIFFLRELGPAAPSCDAPREPSTDGGVAPADLTPQGNPGDSATEFENDNEEYCRSHAGDCFTSVWNGNLVRREDAQRYVDQLRDEVNAIEGSSFGWVEVDAALGSRLVYVVRQDEDGWSFVSEVPSIRGVEQAQLSDGVLQFENVDGQFTYNPDAETWNHTASTP
ncbi:MAG: hypothetical protein Q4P06_09015 [Actinomycetaceae bacterium]|nr:hypothetical protein [Actinomycetaceae bacterium]